MNLRTLEPAEVPRVADWLAQKDNYQWLDFGHGQQALSAPVLALMNKRETHLLRLFTADAADVPIGVVALSDISPIYRTAALWYVLGDKRFGGQGYTTRAVAEMLTVGFRELGLHVVQAWAVEANAASVTVLRRNQFRLVGRLRQAHEIDGRRWDRLLFDLLGSEHVAHGGGTKSRMNA